MKRSGRMRGRGRGQPRRQIEPVMKVKPFVSPEIQTINMELELLKQKRQMIEQHQNLLKSQIIYSQQRQYESEKPRYYEQVSYDSPGPSHSEQNFAQYYDDPVAEDYIPLSSGRKRPADAGWPRGSSPKRFGSRRGNVAQAFGSRLGPKPAPQSQKQMPNVPHTSGQHETARSRKRAKAKSAAPAIASQIVHTGPNKATNKDREAYTLRADREPSTSLNGILELGLGFILKQLKQKYSNSQKYSRMVMREYYARKLKKVLRARIRNILMDKYIDNFADVVDQYRRKFPERTDEELMNTAMIGEPPKPRIDVDLSTEAPRAGMPCPNFFKTNMRPFVAAKLKKMFADIHEMYNPPKENKVTSSASASDVGNNGDNASNTNVTSQRGPAKQSKWKINVASLIDSRLTSKLKGYIPTITAILNMDPEYNSTKAAWLAEALQLDPTVSGEVVIGGLPEIKVKIDPTVDSKPKYYAKVQGIPCLPQRNVMRPFLDTFCPLATKMHKQIKNLLFVTFKDQDNYEKFLAQDGVKLGGSTLDIKVSGKVKQAQIVVNEDTETDGQTSINSKDKNITSIPIDLDNKIDDLLSSIRKGEEETIVNEENTEQNVENLDGNGQQNENNDDELNKNSNECVEQNADVDNTNGDQSNPAHNDAEPSDNTQKTDNAAEQDKVGAENDTTVEPNPPTLNEEMQGVVDKIQSITDSMTTDEQKQNETN